MIDLNVLNNLSNLQRDIYKIIYTYHPIDQRNIYIKLKKSCRSKKYIESSIKTLLSKQLIFRHEDKSYGLPKNTLSKKRNAQQSTNEENQLQLSLF